MKNCPLSSFFLFIEYKLPSLPSSLYGIRFFSSQATHPELSKNPKTYDDEKLYS